MEKALVAMSGGVDSSAALLLLKDKYELTGVTMRLWSEEEALPDCRCISPDENCVDAKKVADLLGIPHLTVALGESFRETVVKNFISEYRNGRTPNPCVECNRRIKFGKLFDLAKELEIPYLATGHYARMIKNADGEFELHKAIDGTKDQSYFLWTLKKELLSHILFPLGEYSKSEIRSLAEKNGFSNARKSDSQDICFVPDGDYISFIKKNDSDKFAEGSFIDTDGNILGKHKGIEMYTIGQRKGLGIALGIPAFVGKKDLSSNTVTLCSDRELYSNKLTANGLNFLTNDSFDVPVRLEAKIRYRHIPSPATVVRTDEDILSVIFDEPQRAISPGQSLVLYDGDRVVGGGIIR